MPVWSQLTLKMWIFINETSWQSVVCPLAAAVQWRQRGISWMTSATCSTTLLTSWMPCWSNIPAQPASPPKTCNRWTAETRHLWTLAIQTPPRALRMDMRGNIWGFSSTILSFFFFFLNPSTWPQDTHLEMFLDGQQTAAEISAYRYLLRM